MPELRAAGVKTTIYEILTRMTTQGIALTDDTTLAGDLGFDSLRTLELAVIVEKKFGLPELNLDRALAVETVRDVVELVTRLTSAAEEVA